MTASFKKIFSIQELAPIIAETVNNGGRVRFTVTGMSMFPLLADRRDAVTVIKPERIKKYDIVLHRRQNGEYIMHRVIGIRDNMLTIAGDNETQKERNVPLSSVVAVVSAIRRKSIEFSVTNFRYRMYSHIWLWVFPLRHCILYALVKLRRLFNEKK